MKVGKRVAIFRNELGVLIYATNMVPQRLDRAMNETPEDFESRVERALALYERFRACEAARLGELDDTDLTHKP